MAKNLRFYIFGVAILGVIGATVKYVSNHNVAVLSPAGQIASQQRNLMIFATLLMLLVVLPVFGLTFYIVWKYRATNSHATYRPDWDHNRLLESIWWGLPCAIILILAIVTWNSSHSLDPSRPIVSSQAPLTVQVVALQWKWLFLYPDQGIASVNYLQLPVGRPVNFQITADAPMNSFWIPQLGGQVYAMSGMTTRLQLIANKPGSYTGSSANLSGAGFSAMHFTAKATSVSDFNNWVASSQIAGGSVARLTAEAYQNLAKPGILSAPKVYNSYDNALYSSIMMKYMSVGHDSTSNSTTQAGIQ